jgi:hypothetical protein
MKLFKTLILSILVISGLQAQYISNVTIPDTLMKPITDMSIPPVKLANGITPSDLKDHLSILASDEYEGRGTGEPGNEKAAQYIKNHFIDLGFKPNEKLDDGYFQPIQFNYESWEDIALNINGQRFRHLWDFLAFQDKNQDMDSLEINKLFFMGYGIDDPAYSDYKNKNVRGKTILIYDGEPMNPAGQSRITNSSTPSEWSTDPDKKLAAAAKYGVKTVIIISNNIKGMLAENRRALLGAKVTMGPIQARPNYPNNIYVSTTIAEALMGNKKQKVLNSRDRITEKGKLKKVKIKNNILLDMDKKVRSLKGNNVLGFIEGTDKKDEVVVLSAHYDHLGKKGESIYNGADDNGSGTTAVLEIAETFAQGLKEGVRPRRSVLFILVTGEEKGLLGSAFYAENPVYDLANTMVDINVDMVGRVDGKYENNPNYIYVIGSDRLSTDLHKINESVNQKYTQLVMDYTYNSEQDPNRYYYRSDHYNFAKNGIPAIFFFNGTHADYHMITDTVEKINFDKMSEITKHIYHLAWELANVEERIIVDGEVKD